MSAVGKLLDRRVQLRRRLRVLGASGQLGYGIPEKSLSAGLDRAPDYIGADMGSIDPGPYYLGSGELATAPATTRADLTRLLRAARKLDVPLLIGTAGSAGAAPHLAKTLAIVRDIAREEGLHFRLASIQADMPRPLVKEAVRSGRVTPIDTMAPLSEADVEEASHLVGQMGTEAFCRALQAEADVVIAGRACDTAIFAAVPALLGCAMGPAMHMAKIIECASLCCVPGGRDPILATLEGDGFVLDSMNPERRATPMSVAAHSLYEQSDPDRVAEPEGVLLVRSAHYEQLDERRTRVSGSEWMPAPCPTVKLEGSARIGERAVLLCGSCDERVIARIGDILAEVSEVVRGLVCRDEPEDYRLIFRVYGINGVYAWPAPPSPLPREIFILGECIAPSGERAGAVVRTTKQYLLHHGFPGRLSTAGNIAFPFTPSELSAGTAYRFNVYHIMQVDALAPLFPVELEDL
ncbi:MAG TPA: acyclic terpene utilization AtuA family protein [Stellaceae bacterium]|nr:acyclic terpene utilization AtuA family protein [Stellaceae bacterium]